MRGFLMLGVAGGGSGLLALLPRPQGIFVGGQVFLVHFQYAKSAAAVAALVIARFAGRLRLRIVG